MKFNFFQIGYILRAKGLKGEVKVSFEAFFLDFLLQKKQEENQLQNNNNKQYQNMEVSQLIDHIFIKNKESQLPYFIETMTINPTDETAIIKFEDIKNKEQATDLRSKPLFIDLNQTPIDLSGEQGEWDFLLDFQVITTDEEELGRIHEVIYFPEHEVAQIFCERADAEPVEVLVPLHEDYIELIDEEAKILLVELPNGFLDLYF